MNAMVSFCEDLKDGQGPLLAQGLRDYTDPLHSEVSEDVVSTCIIPLPFPVKPDFVEDVIKFSGKDSTIIYVIQFHAFEQQFANTKKKLVVQNINLDNSATAEDTRESSDGAETVSESKMADCQLVSVVSS